MGIVIGGLLHPAALNAQPKRQKTLMEWGITAYQQGNDELALRYFKRAWVPQSQLVGLKIVDPTPLVWQAKCYARLGDTVQASKAMNEAAALAQPGSLSYRMATQTLKEIFPPAGSISNEDSPTFHQHLDNPAPLNSTSFAQSKPMLSVHSLRWQRPILIWVQPTMPTSLSPKQRQRLIVSPQELKQLVSQWQPALPQRLPIIVTVDASAANVRLEWVDSIEGTDTPANNAFTSGLTQWKTEAEQIEQASVKISVRGPQGQPRTKVALLQTTLHELGHALGLAQHSTQPGDIMAAHGVGSYHVSPNDLARLQALYSPSMSTTLTVLP
jgi:hypothetical protein